MSVTFQVEGGLETTSARICDDRYSVVCRKFTPMYSGNVLSVVYANFSTLEEGHYGVRYASSGAPVGLITEKSTGTDLDIFPELRWSVTTTHLGIMACLPFEDCYWCL